MRVALLSREYPPEVYGGASVHVEYLARELAQLVDLEVHCWGSGASECAGVSNVGGTDGRGTASRGASGDTVDLVMAAGLEGAAVAHSHTW